MISPAEYLKSEYISLYVKITVQELKYVLSAINITQSGNKDELLERVLSNKQKILNMPDDIFGQLSIKLVFLSEKREHDEARRKLVSIVEKYCASQKQFVYFCARNLKSILQAMNLPTNMQNVKLVESLRKNKNKIVDIPTTEWEILRKGLNFKGTQRELLSVVQVHEKIFKTGLTDSELAKRYDLIRQQKIENENKKSELQIQTKKTDNFMENLVKTISPDDEELQKFCENIKNRYDEIQHFYDSEVDILSTFLQYINVQLTICPESDKSYTNIRKLEILKSIKDKYGRVLDSELISSVQLAVSGLSLNNSGTAINGVGSGILRTSTIINETSHTEESELKKKLQEETRKRQALEQENNQLKNNSGILNTPNPHASNGICYVCFDNPISTIFKTCGHMKCCGKCAKNMNACPFCRTPYKQEDVVVMY